LQVLAAVKMRETELFHCLANEKEHQGLFHLRIQSSGNAVLSEAQSEMDSCLAVVMSATPFPAHHFGREVEIEMPLHLIREEL